MKHADIIQKLNLEQKCALLSGETVFTTRAPVSYTHLTLPTIA